MILPAFLIFRGYRQKQKANLEIKKQKELVEEKQKEILDSIHYARRIQNSLLPNEKYIQRKMEWLRSSQPNKKARYKPGFFIDVTTAIVVLASS